MKYKTIIFSGVFLGFCVVFGLYLSVSGNLLSSHYSSSKNGDKNSRSIVIFGSNSSYRLTPFTSDEIEKYHADSRISENVDSSYVVDILKCYQIYFETGIFPSEVSVQGLPSIRLSLVLGIGMDYYFMKPSNYSINDKKWTSLMLVGVPEGGGVPVYTVHKWIRVNDGWEVVCVW